MLLRLVLSTPLMALLALAPSARAQTWHRPEIFLTSAGQTRTMTLVSAGDFLAPAPAAVDYAVFVTELAAFLTKEVLHDTHDEYDGSLLGSHLSSTMPDANSEFGSHCLTIVTRIGSALPFSSPSSSLVAEPPTLLGAVARTAATGLALHQIWSAFKNDVENNRAGVSLNPKVSSRRVGANVTIHW
jgi:hypothetical protein